jgi:hypothetical protein
MKTRKSLVIGAMVVGLLLAIAGAVAMARGSGGSERTAALPGMMRQSGGGVALQQGVRGGIMRGGSGMMLRGTVNGQVPGQMAQLMQEHAKDMAAWWQKYGSDPTSVAAQQALQQLRAEHQADMQKLWQQSPGTSRSGGGGSYGPGMMGGASGGMMGGW